MLKINPDDHEALTNWGLTVGDQAKTNSGEKADRLFAQAYAKYAAAMKIKPDQYEALNNWGLTLREHARTKTGSEAERLNSLAEEKFEAARSLHSSNKSYKVT